MKYLGIGSAVVAAYMAFSGCSGARYEARNDEHAKVNPALKQEVEELAALYTNVTKMSRELAALQTEITKREVTTDSVKKDIEWPFP